MGQGCSGELEERWPGCRVLVWDPESRSWALPSPRTCHRNWGSWCELGPVVKLLQAGRAPACAGSIPTAKQNPLLAQLKLTTSDGTSVTSSEGDPCGWALRRGGARLLPARYLRSGVGAFSFSLPQFPSWKSRIIEGFVCESLRVSMETRLRLLGHLMWDSGFSLKS